jgi:ribosome biogenesis GTPase
VQTHEKVILEDTNKFCQSSKSKQNLSICVLFAKVGHMRGKIIKSDRKEFECLLVDGSITRAKAMGNLFKNDSLIVGDKVLLESTDDDPVIIERIQRFNSVFRRHTRSTQVKHIAANIDVMAIMVSVSKPAFKRGLIDRYLVKAYQWNIKPIIIFNKIDQLETNSPVDLEFEKERLNSLDIPCYILSAKHPDYQHQPNPSFGDLNQLKSDLKENTIIFLGQSGVGKSKLIKALTDQKVDLESGELAKVGKGAHTTTWSQLISFPPYEFIDSPGIRSLSILDLEIEELSEYFPDLADLFVQCQFNNCEHTKNSKGCALFQGSYQDNPYIHSRLESYQRFKEELDAEKKY